MQWIGPVLAMALAVAVNAWAGVEDDVARVRQEWELIKYRLPAAEQATAFEALARRSKQLMVQNPARAEPAIWHGIVEASYAGAKGGLGALSAVQNARKALEQALLIDAGALDGSAYTSLGTLYYQVPGWPIGFGDDRKALELLQKGLAINPDGIYANYFHCDFLYRMGDYAGAEAALQKALAAAPRPGRSLADEGRRREIAALLEKIRDRKR
jgi:tetratricopeptide (TPR) repeat protein